MGLSRKDIASFLHRLANKFNAGILIEINGDELHLGAYSSADVVIDENITQENFLCRTYTCDLSDSQNFITMLEKVDTDIREMDQKEWGILIGNDE